MMSEVIQQETIVFLLSVLHGIGLTFCYDLIRAFRRAFAHNLIAVSIEDFLFWMAAGFLTFCLAFFRTDGTIRGYVAAGIAIGVILYHFSVSPLVVKGVSWILMLIKRVFCIIFRVIAVPLKKICQIWKKIIEFVWKRGYNNFRKKIRGKHYVKKREKAQQQ